MFNPQQAQPSPPPSSGSGGAQQAAPQSPPPGTASPGTGSNTDAKSTTSGAASPGSSQGLHPAQRDQEPTAAEQQKDAQKQNEPNPQASGGGGATTSGDGQGAPSGGSKAGGSVLTLTDAEKEKIRRVIRSYSIAPAERVNFPLRLGALVPANVELKPLPPEVASAVPDYKNYSFVATQNQIAIVITEKREIDVLIPG